MQLTIPHSGLNHQVRLTIRHPNWETTATLDDSHKKFELTAPDGDDINDIEVFVEYLGATGAVDTRFPAVSVKEKVLHVEQTNVGESGESDAADTAGDVEHPKDGDAADAGLQGDAATGSVSEASLEQSDEQAETVTPSSPPVHHRTRRPRHA